MTSAPKAETAPPRRKALESFSPEYVFFIATILMTAASLALRFRRLDTPLMLGVYRRFGVPHRQFWVAMTGIGSTQVLLPVVAVAAILLLLRKHREHCLWLVAGWASTSLAVQSLKWLFARERPPLASIGGAVGYSFPSGHAAESLFVFLYLWTILAGSRFVRGWGAAGSVAVEAGAVFFTVLAVLVGYSRVCLGVHWPSDVTGGWAIGFLFLQIAILCSPKHA